MGEFISKIVIGIIIIIIGVLNIKGNISLIHSYHTKRVKKNDISSFGKLLGIGTIIVGFTIMLAGISDLLWVHTFKNISIIVLIIGFSLGFSIVFYALFKYNKGIF